MHGQTENALGGESLPGHGQHGGLAAYEQSPFLFVQGGGFAPGVRREPASPIDLAPMCLRHLGLAAEGVDGRAPALQAAAAKPAASSPNRPTRTQPAGAT